MENTECPLNGIKDELERAIRYAYTSVAFMFLSFNVDVGTNICIEFFYFFVFI